MLPTHNTFSSKDRSTRAANQGLLGWITSLLFKGSLKPTDPKVITNIFMLFKVSHSLRDLELSRRGTMISSIGSRRTLEYLIYSFKEGHQLRSINPKLSFFHSFKIPFKYQVGSSNLPHTIHHHSLKGSP